MSNKKMEFRERRRRRERNQRLAIIGLITAGALLIAFGLIWPSIRPIENVVMPDLHDRAGLVINDNTIGDPNAPIEIINFSDYQCPYCKAFADQTEEQILKAYVATGKVRFTFRSMGNFISNNIARYRGTVAQTESEDAAQAAYCAGDQGKFWEYHDALFANWLGEDVGSFTPRRLAAIADLLGLDTRAFQDCLNNGKYAQRVRQDGLDGAAYGINGTPSFVLIYQVNGVTRTKLIEGAVPFSQFQKEIEAALAEIGQ